MSTDIAYKPVRELRALLLAGKITPLELVDLFASRIKAHQGVSKAFITQTLDDARIQAGGQSKKDVAKGALAGIAYGCKDLFDVKGVLTSAGSKVFHDRIATEDSFVVGQMRGAGAISLGKLNTHEFAYGATGENPHFGTCVNAYDTTRLAGGSSSGAAAALAFGLLSVAFGTDTGGSVRVPAALNGLVGFKPTMGRVPVTGVVPYSWTLDHVGIMTRTVADAADVLGVVAGHDPRDPASANVPVDDYASGLEAGVKGLRIGIPTAFFNERADAEIVAATQRVTDWLVAQGAVVVPVEFPDMAHTRAVSLTVQMPEALSAHSAYLRDRGDLYGEDFRAGLALGQCILAEHYIRAKRFIEQYRQRTNEIFREVDVVVTPGTPVIAPKVGEAHIVVDGKREPAGNAMTRYTTFFNMTGHPALTMPSGMHSAGLPMSVQFVGRHFEEATVLQVARAVETSGKFGVPLPSVG